MSVGRDGRDSGRLHGELQCDAGGDDRESVLAEGRHQLYDSHEDRRELRRDEEDVLRVNRKRGGRPTRP